MNGNGSWGQKKQRNKGKGGGKGGGKNSTGMDFKTGITLGVLLSAADPTINLDGSSSGTSSSSSSSSVGTSKTQAVLNFLGFGATREKHRRRSRSRSRSRTRSRSRDRRRRKEEYEKDVQTRAEAMWNEMKKKEAAEHSKSTATSARSRKPEESDDDSGTLLTSGDHQGLKMIMSKAVYKKVQHVRNAEEMEEVLNTLQKDSLLKEMELFGFDNKTFLKRKANTPKDKIVVALFEGVSKKIQSSRP